MTNNPNQTKSPAIACKFNQPPTLGEQLARIRAKMLEVLGDGGGEIPLVPTSFQPVQEGR